ncbi:hypothetical protein HYH03_003128 [Edaphochlamys debaryana]|uniref:Rubisco LSMT substrate-binding domain-containing protein n=1 Tax=Edaphochlamys debaryana TaxID=47281 RepID=A0A835YCV4_9CHLO|nr:hypothetical protein HYH03_003128 [Edaphochlamys debaryana]|eukprot:KAG2498938.1 hypothetical protein HYH03_003128 [Edaphochlamys debaryana]
MLLRGPPALASGRCPAISRRQAALHPAVRRPVVRAAAAASATDVGFGLSIADALALVDRTRALKESLPGLKADAVGVQRLPGDVGERVALVAGRDIRDKEAVMTIPEKLAITRVDAEAHDLVGALAAECSELTALTLWLVAERHRGAASQHAALLGTLPESTLTPLLWSDKELDELLTGSPVGAEARVRREALQKQWADLEPKLRADTAKFPPAAFSEQAFMRAFSVVCGHAAFLPAAGCFALLPLASLLGRTGNGNGCDLDFDPELNAVVVTTTRPYRAGSELLLNDGRPNGELVLATGSVQESNTADYLDWPASLVQADKYYMLKAQVLESMGFGPKENFPVYADRMPIQLLAYLRLARVADPGLMAKISFEKDIELSQMNEYEILQILMGDCRERLAVYPKSYEEDVKIAQQRDLNPRERIAVKLRLAERKILNATMDAVRRRLAPIRGIPTKTGAMVDPNSDFKEIFDTIESIPMAPIRALEGFMSWARGDQDPDWGKKPGQGQNRGPPRK